MIREGNIVCNGCEKVISRVSNVPADGWPRLRNLCPACFQALWKRSIPRA